MIKLLKSNKLILLFLFSICIFFIIKPTICSTSCLNAVSVWGLKVFPMLFPFFIITRLIISITNFKPNIMDKFFNKAYHTPTGSFFVFFLSILCGYPMGAKLVGSLYEDGNISSKQAFKMLSFCSVSGPMFMMGTVGVAILNSFKAGVVIFVCNLLACLINGLIYRGKPEICKDVVKYNGKAQGNVLSNAVYDSLISILLVGGYIIFSFIIIDVLKEIGLIKLLATSLSSLTNCTENMAIFESVGIGFIEMTRGIIELNATSASLCLKTILASAIISFGGISIMLQSIGFLKNIKINVKHIFLQKITQCLICLLISIPACLIFI